MANDKIIYLIFNLKNLLLYSFYDNIFIKKYLKN